MFSSLLLTIILKNFLNKNFFRQFQKKISFSGEKPFQCTYCEKAFSVKDYLTKHIRTHTGEKPYTCPYCEKRFTQRSALTVHTTKLHPLQERPNGTDRRASGGGSTGAGAVGGGGIVIASVIGSGGVGVVGGTVGVNVGGIVNNNTNLIGTDDDNDVDDDEDDRQHERRQLLMANQTMDSETQTTL